MLEVLAGAGFIILLVFVVMLTGKLLADALFSIEKFFDDENKG